MYKLLCLLFQKKFLIIVLVLTCICRSIVVLFLNKGYARLVDCTLENRYDIIFHSSIMLLSIGILQVIVIFFQNFMASILSEKMGYIIREKTIKGILNTEYKNIENLSIGESLSKFNSDLSGITAWIKNELVILISDSILFIIILFAMFSINWKLTVISFCLVPFFTIGSYLLSKPITIYEKEKNKAISDVNIIVKSIIDAYPVFKLFNMKQPLFSKTNEKINRSVCLEIKANRVRAKLMSINGFLSYLPTIILWGAGGYMTLKGELTAGIFLAFINMSGFVNGPLLNLPARIDSIRTSSSNISRVFSMLEKLKYRDEGGSHMKFDENAEIAIEFRNVTFGYSENKNILENISFKIPSGSKVVIVGESGCGKSTVLKLMAGLYQISSGEIFFFGTNLSKRDNRNLIAFVSQEALLFPVSIYENITCGHPMAEEDVLKACKGAQLESLIRTLPEGIHSNIGECGNKLSGGERQRISIARAIAKDAPLFLLDEATSALDGETEIAVLKFFHTVMNKKTIIYVTHKTKHAIDADLVICMKNGKTAEIGTHESLIKQDGYYSNLYKLQNILEVPSNESYQYTVL